MNFRTRLLIVVAVMIVVSVFLTSAITYVSARRHLESAARKQMEQTVALIAKQSQIGLERFKMDMELLAESRLVRDVTRSPKNESLVREMNLHFLDIVRKNNVYSSINLIDRDAWCIASSYPDRIGYSPMRQMVATRPDFKAAIAGQATISQVILSHGTGRPIIAISVPVREDGKVMAVVRSTLDLNHINDYFLAPQETILGGKAYVYDPWLDTSLPKGWVVPNIIRSKPYMRPDIPDLPELATSHSGVVSYATKSGRRLAAFLKTSEPEFLFVVERPLRDVLAPIETMGKVTLATLVVMLFVITIAVFRMANPLLRKLEACMAFVEDIKAGILDRRLEAKGTDEISGLARGLNTMAQGIEESRNALEEAERLYRGLFENAVEGIFVTDLEGVVLNANPAFASLLGYRSPADLVGRNVSRYYSSARRNRLLDVLESRGTVKNFEVLFHRCDGSQRIGSIYARADRDEKGKILRIQGILDDITEQKEIEKERRRAEDAELRSVQARLEALRYQINPHFLFNVLNSLSALARISSRQTDQLIQQLSCYLRSTISSSESGFVPLSQEMGTIESYLNIEKVRFEEDLMVNIDLPTQVMDVRVPELILQPIVENAVKYGTKTSELPLRITIEGSVTDDRLLLLKVTNTGHWVSTEDGERTRKGVGIENLRKRLNLIYANRYLFQTEEDSGLVRVVLGVPLETGTRQTRSQA
ncbi:MAG: Sensor histidine kinase YehU [Syntrophorhabdus sp. PtaB.Bin184]|jgi:PAS domain S-box-containing protein|nr:MAG: Sensor histidine kinase YehU [Syntrophorhabdus sp. PtaB.Bin184]